MSVLTLAKNLARRLALLISCSAGGYLRFAEGTRTVGCVYIWYAREHFRVRWLCSSSLSSSHLLLHPHSSFCSFLLVGHMLEVGIEWLLYPHIWQSLCANEITPIPLSKDCQEMGSIFVLTLLTKWYSCYLLWHNNCWMTYNMIWINMKVYSLNKTTLEWNFIVIFF